MAFVAYLILFMITIYSPHQLIASENNLDDDCLRCICSAISECDDQVRCHSEGQNKYFCGPFQITRNYWQESGAPGYDPNNPLDFEDCANNIYCSIQTVNQYLKIKQKDCDLDGLITCQDYALLHKFGPKNCTEKRKYKKSPFWHKFEVCFFAQNGTNF